MTLDEDYYVIEKKLKLVGQLFECQELCVDCYKFLLDEVYGLERIEAYCGRTIKEFAHDYPNGIYLIRIEGHLTNLFNGTNFDLWNCLNEKIDIIWKVY